MKRTGPPTQREVEAVIQAREVGARLVGDFAPRELPDGRYAVKVCAYLSLQPLPDIVLERDGPSWAVVKRKRTEAREEDDPVVVRAARFSE